MASPWVSTSLHEDLAAAIDTFLATNKRGFTSRAEVISAAVREFLERESAPRVDEKQIGDAIERYMAKARERHGIEGKKPRR